MRTYHYYNSLAFAVRLETADSPPLLPLNVSQLGNDLLEQTLARPGAAFVVSLRSPEEEAAALPNRLYSPVPRSRLAYSSSFSVSFPFFLCFLCRFLLRLYSRSSISILCRYDCYVRSCSGSRRRPAFGSVDGWGWVSMRGVDAGSGARRRS